MQKKYIKLFGIFLVTVLTVVLIYLGHYTEVDRVYSMKVDHFESFLVELETEKEELDKGIKQLYADNNQTYIIQSLNKEDISETEENVKSFEENIMNLNKKLYDLTPRDQKKYAKVMNEKRIMESLEKYTMSIKDLRVKKELTDLLNSLFSTKYMEEAEIDSDVYITTDLTTEKFEKVATRIGQRIKDSASLNIEEYSKAVDDGLEIAEKQLSDLNRAIALRDELFNENDFLVETDNEKIKEFQLAVEQIKNPEIQATFAEYLIVAEAYESEELESELEDADELDENESVEQDDDDYQSPSSTGSSSGSSWSGSSSGSTTGSSNSSTGSTNSESTSGSSSGESSNNPSSGSNDEPSDDSNSDSNNESSDDSNNDSSSGLDDESLDDSNNDSNIGSDESSDESSNGSNNESTDESVNNSTNEDSAD